MRLWPTTVVAHSIYCVMEGIAHVESYSVCVLCDILTMCVPQVACSRVSVSTMQQLPILAVGMVHEFGCYVPLAHHSSCTLYILCYGGHTTCGIILSMCILCDILTMCVRQVAYSRVSVSIIQQLPILAVGMTHEFALYVPLAHHSNYAPCILYFEGDTTCGIILSMCILCDILTMCVPQVVYSRVSASPLCSSCQIELLEWSMSLRFMCLWPTIVVTHSIHCVMEENSHVESYSVCVYYVISISCMCLKSHNIVLIPAAGITHEFALYVPLVHHSSYTLYALYSEGDTACGKMADWYIMCDILTMCVTEMCVLHVVCSRVSALFLRVATESVDDLLILLVSLRLVCTIEDSRTW
jgi:hypothetical protein